MATYKMPCIHCGNMLERDARFCPKCGSGSPFGYACPNCLRNVEKGQALCAGCGRQLVIPCPHCGERTFASEKCEACDKGLMVRCENKRCGQLQFFQNTKCNACGKKIKTQLQKG